MRAFLAALFPSNASVFNRRDRNKHASSRRPAKTYLMEEGATRGKKTNISVSKLTKDMERKENPCVRYLLVMKMNRYICSPRGVISVGDTSHHQYTAISAPQGKSSAPFPSSMRKISQWQQRYYNSSNIESNKWYISILPQEPIPAIYKSSTSPTCHMDTQTTRRSDATTWRNRADTPILHDGSW